MAGYLFQAGAFTAAGAALSGYALYKDIKYAGQKRKFESIDEGIDISADLKRQRFSPMAMRSRFRGRRRFRRRRFRRKRFGRRKFAKRVRRVMLRTLEPRKIATSFAQSFAEADVTNRLVYVNCPPSALVQGTGGTQDDQVDGNKVFLRGMVLRGQVAMDNTTPTANGVIFRVTACFTKEQGSGFQGGFVVYNSTTTSAANPAQVPPDTNPRFFDAVVPQAFIGGGNVIPFDRTNVKVLKQWTYLVNPGADTIASELSLPTIVKCYLPINKMVQFEDAGQLGLTTAPRRFKKGNWFFVVQVIASSGPPFSTDTLVNGSFRTEVFWKDI